MFKKILIYLIKSILWCIDKNHRTNNKIGDDDTKKFTHQQPMSFQSDFAQGTNLFRTVPYECWELKTETKTIYGADKHLLYQINGETIWLQDCEPGKTRLQTENGEEIVTSVRNLNFKMHMYDVQIDHPKHWYYTNGILSHNTTCAAAYLVWRAIFVPDQTILIAANKLSSALEIMQRIRYAYEELPEWLKAGAETYNKGTLEFDNGSRIISRATTPDAGRGLSISLLYLDEFAFVRPKIAEEFWTAIQPTLSTGGSCIITSTPNSDEDQFAQLWFGAINTIDDSGKERENGVGVNGFKAIKVTWDEHPERDDDWAKEQILKLGEDRFNRENNCKFIQADETLIAPAKLATLQGIDPVLIDEDVRWYSVPETGKTYVVGLDPSMGTGSDYAAIQVFQLPEMIQVAEWRGNSTTPKDQVAKLQRVLKRIQDTLNSAGQYGELELYWTIENNTVGEAVLIVIDDTGEDKFPGTFMHEPRRPGLGKGRRRKGLNTTNKSKITAATKFKSLIETERLAIYSKALITELKGYTRVGLGFKAKYGYTDDLIASSLLCIRLLIMLSSYDENFDDMLKDSIDGDDGSSEPMPIMLG